MRLPPTNHGDGDNGFIAALIGMARASGNAGYIGDGSNRWPAVHRLDSARLFRLAVEKAPAGSTLHAVADEDVLELEVAVDDARLVQGLHDYVIGSLPAIYKMFGFLAGFIGLDAPASSVLTRELLGWQPTQPGLIEDLGEGHYFSRPSQ